MRISDWSSDVCSSDLEEGDGEISEKNAGVSFKDEDEVEEEPEADADGEEGDAAKKRENFEEDEEDNTLSLAAMEELLKPDALEKFAAITKSFQAFETLQDARLEALSAAGEEFPAASLKKYNKLREELTALRSEEHTSALQSLMSSSY